MGVVVEPLPDDDEKGDELLIEEACITARVGVFGLGPFFGL